MSDLDALPAPAYLGGLAPMTRTPVVGVPVDDRASMYVPGAEDLSPGEIRVTVLGSGDPWIRRSQASGSLLIEVGNPGKDFFFFDLGSGSLANFTSLMLPVESTTKVFLSHLHADHVGDIPGLVGSFAKAGRIDPVEIWGGASEDPTLGLAAFVDHMGKAMAWDAASVRGVRPTTGFDLVAHEIPYDRPEAIYERRRRHHLQLPGDPRPERCRRLQHHVCRVEGRLLGRHAPVQARRRRRGRRGPVDS
jgi:ribonuclease Z